jgi:hypothetical protein
LLLEKRRPRGHFHTAHALLFAPAGNLFPISPWSYRKIQFTITVISNIVLAMLSPCRRPAIKNHGGVTPNTYLEMKAFGPWNTLIADDMKHFATVMVARSDNGTTTGVFKDR